ncbi:hypothetical protein SLA2020_214170 [Shorea laevis]
MMMTEGKHLFSVANDVLHQCAEKLDTSVDKLVREFEAEWTPETGDYSRKLVEFFGSKALITDVCRNVEEKINDPYGSFSKFTFDMMLAWEKPTSEDENNHTESIAKEKEDIKKLIGVANEQADIPLFYSDLMPLLVDEGPSVGEDAFVWLASLVPLIADVVNARFTFETLTAPTGNQLHFPAYDKYLKEISQSIKNLQKQNKPKGVELADDEFILHREGTASTQRVVRHIGGTSWPGRLTLTNYALYFETSGVITYDDALKIDLSKNIDHSVKPIATGPWGAPLFDKAIVYESPELSEGVILEFPEITGSTRRDHWLALVREVISMHQFLSKFNLESSSQAWEMHARTILGIIRLHQAREMLRISIPIPTKFLIFSLCDELPKGDFVLEELAQSLKRVNSRHPCSASSILRSMNASEAIVSSKEVDEAHRTSIGGHNDNHASLETAIDQARKEVREIKDAKASTEGLKQEGISRNVLVLKELLEPLRSVFLWFQEIVEWGKPANTLLAIATTLLIIYKEWIGKAISLSLLLVVAKMLQARRKRIHNKLNEIVVFAATNQTTRESIVSAQFGFLTLQETLQEANIVLLKMHSIFVSRAPKHADLMILALCGLAILLAVIPFKFVMMAALLYYVFTTSKLGKSMKNVRSERRLKEWWDSIPIIPVRIIDDPAACPK